MPASDPLDRERRRLAGLFDIAPSRVLYALCALGVADRVPEDGIGADALADALGVHRERLTRLVRAAETLDVLRVDDGRMVRLTPAGTLLRSDRPGSLRAEFSDNALFTAWGPFAQTIADGRPAYELAHGTAIFDSLGDDREALRTFHEHMRMRAHQLYRPLVPALLRHSGPRVLDLGGGTGGLSELLLAGDDRLRVTLTDLPDVVDLVPGDLPRRYPGRFRAEPGDMRTFVPDGHDTYVLGSILHDWPDDVAAGILARCAEAVRRTSAQSTVVLLERVLDDDRPDPRRMDDMWMMAMTGGRERTRAEWAELAADAGLVLRAVESGGELSAVVLGPEG
ncbi:methyltransferase [Streptomyces sp. NPDC014734]|uniref:methyltransferase n=1 Tax=Streptomyces sp. NPDC014734 TaxID=3364886 RepID=UPI0036FB3AB2